MGTSKSKGGGEPKGEEDPMLEEEEVRSVRVRRGELLPIGGSRGNSSAIVVYASHSSIWFPIHENLLETCLLA